MKRADALAWIRIAGYHSDSTAAMRIYVESRISRRAFDDAWAAGEKQRAAGVRCGCIRCAGADKQ